jgi:hypothetical protein
VFNNSIRAISANIWTIATLPNERTYGPILNRPITLEVGDTLIQTMTQNVPANAPAGDYNFNGYIGIYPNIIWNSDSFPFTKSEP